MQDLYHLVGNQEVVTGLREAEEMLGPTLDLEVITNLEANRWGLQAKML